MIWFDTTKSGRAEHRSGLMRVSSRLRAELSARAESVAGGSWVDRAQPGDWFLTAEVFSPAERPGWDDLLAQRPCRLAAIFHDAIPLKFPQITWPQSVARHPAYLKMLARFDRVWAVSEASRHELLGYWRWLGVVAEPPVDVLALGADFDGSARVVDREEPAAKALLGLGILEPRKNQLLLLETCEQLWNEGLEFSLHVVGRTNPHFGGPIVARIKESARRYRGLRYHAAVDDRVLGRLFGEARAVVFPTIAEGCGLPVLEALWRGVPVVCSDLPVLRENTLGGGCLLAPVNERGAWVDALRKILTDDGLQARLQGEARSRALPTWRAAAETIAATLGA